MINFKTIFLAIFLALSQAVHSHAQSVAGFEARTFVSSSGYNLPYRLFKPANFQPGKKYPLVLFLHKEWDRGRDNLRQIKDILPWSKDDFQSKRPCFILAPQCPNWREVVQVYGFNNDLANAVYRDYVGSEKKWKRLSIPIGKHYTGKASSLFFFNDDWGKDTPLESLFRNVKVFEAGKEAKAATLVFKKEAFTPYAGGGRNNNPIIEDGGATVHLLGDTRRKIAFPYTVTKNTVIEFDFKSGFQGNLHGIGFDDDDALFETKWVQVDPGESAITQPAVPSAPLKSALELLLGALLKELPGIDANRLYLTGVGMGGSGVWDLMSRKPELFAAAVPISAAADYETAESIRNLPTWVFHGGADGNVQKTRNMIAALANAGGQPLYTEYSGVGWECWERAYSDPKLADWLFLQKRNTSSPSPPSNLKAIPMAVDRVALSWTAPLNARGVREYRVYRDGGEIASTKGARYTDTETNENEVHSYTVATVSERGTVSAKTALAWAKIGADTLPLKATSVQALGSPFLIQATFNKPLNPELAGNAANYVLDHGLTVNRAVVSKDRRSVLLTTPALQEGEKYSLILRDLRDTAAKPNSLQTNSKFDFTYSPELAAYWKFDDGEGNLGSDASGNNNAVIFRTSDWVRGKYGKALMFDGIPDHIAWARDSRSLDLRDAMTVSMWIKKSAGHYKKQVLLAKNRYYDKTLQFVLDLDDSQQVRAVVGTDTGIVFISGKRLDAKEWHHVAFSYGAGTLELFIDGVSQGKTSGGKLNVIHEAISVGGGYQGRDPFKGAIDEVHIYNRALSPAEAEALSLQE